MATQHKTQRIRYRGRTRDLPVDCGNSLVVDTFTSGQCHSFARAMHRLTGWPLYALAWRKGPVAATADHVVCKAPDGRFVDVEGAWWRGEKWRHLERVVPVSESTVRRLGWDAQDVRAALPFARQVAAGLKMGGV